MFDSGPLSSRSACAVGSSSAGGAVALPGEGGGRSVNDLLIRVGSRARARVRPEVLLLLTVAGFLNLWDLSRNGWANGYYAAAVRSMSTSWHNFFYNSFDPSGVMTVDKPPLAFWIQALSARIFGFNSLAVLVPEALLGMGTVVVLYDLVRRRFGRVAGVVAGLTLAITPIQVAMSRHNNPDMALIFCCVVALWFAQRAFEDGRTKWLVWAGVFVGLGFEAKMAVALIVVPGIALAWLWTSRRGLWRSLRQLLLGGVAMTAVALAWPVFVWLTPAADRPYISGTADNSIWSLITGYNGLGRISGQSGGPGGGGFGGGGGSTFGGNPGVFRLLNEALGGQAGWLLGFAAVSLVGLVALRRLRRRDPGTAWTISIGSAFVISAIVFSVAKGIMHPYYVSFLAPFAAALVGAGAAQLIKHGRHARILTPLAIAGGVATELVVLHTEDTLKWLVPVVIVVGVGAALALVLVSVARVRLVAVGAVLAALSIAPAAWAVDTLGYATSSTFPSGGPENAGGGFGGFGGRGGFPGRGGRGGFGGGAGGVAGGGVAGGGGAATGGSSSVGGAVSGLFGSSNSTTGRPGAGAFAGGGFAGGGFGGGGFGGGGFGGGGFGGGNDASLTEAVSYADAHGGGTVAVSSQSDAENEIIDHDARVAGIGGFSGNESEVSAGWLADEVRSGKIRWVLDDSAGGFGGGISGGRVGSRDAMEWVSRACVKATTVDGSVLYDCSGRAAAILAVANRKAS